MLNGIWLGFFIAAFAAALWQWLGVGDSEVFSRLVASLFDMARLRTGLARLIEPAEVAALASFLMSEDAAMVTGTSYVMDGGWTAQ